MLANRPVPQLVQPRHRLLHQRMPRLLIPARIVALRRVMLIAVGVMLMVVVRGAMRRYGGLRRVRVLVLLTRRPGKLRPELHLRRIHVLPGSRLIVVREVRGRLGVVVGLLGDFLGGFRLEARLDVGVDVRGELLARMLGHITPSSPSSSRTSCGPRSSWPRSCSQRSSW